MPIQKENTKKNFIAYQIGLSIILVFSFKMFQSTPLEKVFFILQAVFFSFVIIFLFAYLFSSFFARKYLDWDIYLLLSIILFIPIVSAYSAYINFQQPIIYGLLSERNWLVIGAGLLIYYMLINNKITFYELEKTFVSLAIASLMIYSFFYLFIGQSVISENGNFGHITENRGVRYQFQNYFITFGLIYFFIAFVRRKKIFSLVMLTSIFLYVSLLHQGRIYLLSILLIIIIYSIFNIKLRKLFVVGFSSIIFIGFIAFLVSLFFPVMFSSKMMLFNEMFYVLFTGEESSDASSNARLYAVSIVLNFFNNNQSSILFGAGNISNQFNYGWKSIFGFFFPSDIGLLGGFFLYGIVGVFFLYLTPIFIGIKILRNTSRVRNDFIHSIRYILIYMLIIPQQSSGYFAIASLAIPIFILKAYTRLNSRVNKHA